MIIYAVPSSFVCGSCGFPMLPHGDRPYNAVKAGGILQVICTHRECADYDKPMEFDLPRIELRKTTNPKILEQIPKPKLVLLNG